MRRHALSIAKTCRTDGCGRVFFGVPQHKYCSACQKMSKKASDRASVARRTELEGRDHLTDAQVEEVFQQALAQIRRERKHEADVSTSCDWKYEEPGR